MIDSCLHYIFNFITFKIIKSMMRIQRYGFPPICNPYKNGRECR